MPGKSKFLTRHLNQTAVYWGGPAADGWGGRAFDAAVEISVRWEDRSEVFVDERGRQHISRAWVWADQAMDLGGYLYLGELVDLSSAPDPKDTTSAYEILKIEYLPALDGTRILRRAIL